MDWELLLVIFIVALALGFDFINGFHDAANSVATIVSTRVLTPTQAVIWAAFFNFVAAFGLGIHVANTIGKGIIETSIVDEKLILAALVGAIVWDIITWRVGLPTSSSHALIGGLIGAALVSAGPDVIIKEGVERTSAFIVISPMVGFIAAVFLALGVMRLYARVAPSTAQGVFRRLQLLSAAASAAAILFATQVGIPVSTTQTIAGGVIGVVSTRRLSAVRWGVAFNIVIAWVLTIPASAAVAALTFAIVDEF